ncbi:hypothetical protein BAME_30600 [Bacillus sp. M 2-6]|nr:hypothetical protein BAME_30600 [Bacillus sp. M 2-6]
MAGFGGIRRKGEVSDDEAFPLSVDEQFYCERRILLKGMSCGRCPLFFFLFPILLFKT